MATNKINFNNSTGVTLKGIYWNGSKIEGCKGIKLNGNIVVVVADYELKWSDYTDAYNAVWTSSDTTVETKKMAQMTGQNEFAICRSAWMLYTRQEFTASAVGNDTPMFNFNSDGRLYIRDDTIVQNWATLLEQYTEPITIASVHNKIPLYSMLTGLPLIYKKEDATFAATKILDTSGSDEGSYDISYDSTNGKWAIGLADLSEIKNPGSVAITESDITTAINNTLGVTTTASDGIITVVGAENWGEFEFLDALSNVYVPGFGPFYEDEGTHPHDTDELYCLIPNENFLAQPYWNVNITSEIRIKNPWLDTLNPCDFYILTGWGLQYILEKTGSTTGDYYAQGENNAEVNITYFDTSCFAGLQHPNILCGMNSAYSSFRPPVIFENGNWAGVLNTTDYGNQTTVSMFPTDCPYLINDTALPALNLPEAMTEWIAENSLQNANVTCELNQTLEQDYKDGSDIIPETIADTVFIQYKESHLTNFPYNNPSNPTKVVEYALKLKMRTYPSDATGSGATGATDGGKWYLNAYDPLNVGGYYPVKKTTTTTAGNMYKTTVNYTAQ